MVGIVALVVGVVEVEVVLGVVEVDVVVTGGGIIVLVVEGGVGVGVGVVLVVVSVGTAVVAVLVDALVVGSVGVVDGSPVPFVLVILEDMAKIRRPRRGYSLYGRDMLVLMRVNNTL